MKEYLEKFMENEYVKAFITNDGVKHLAQAIVFGLSLVVACYIIASVVLWMNPFATIAYLHSVACGFWGYLFRGLGIMGTLFAIVEGV